VQLLIFNKLNCRIKIFCLQRQVSANQVVKVAKLNVLSLNINLEWLILRQVQEGDARFNHNLNPALNCDSE